MFATKNIQLKFLKIILITIRLMTNLTALILYWVAIAFFMFIAHLNEGIEGITEYIKLDEEDLLNDFKNENI
ncbi:hypothetical protein [uncultured Mediterranean phage uvMED]|nr:hypothetical protein [uncultured Mediterranean phage uvMED]